MELNVILYASLYNFVIILNLILFYKYQMFLLYLYYLLYYINHIHHLLAHYLNTLCLFIFNHILLENSINYLLYVSNSILFHVILFFFLENEIMGINKKF